MDVPERGFSLTAGGGDGQGTRRTAVAALLLAVLLAGPTLAAAEGEVPPPAVVLVAVRPASQGRELIRLFEGTGWEHPAAVLSAWKRAAGPDEPRSLGKTAEAVIAALNPETVRELELLDGLRIALNIDHEGAPRWSATVPGDDGTFAAMATAIALTDGASLPPEGPFRVDRLGPVGSPLLAAKGATAILASDRPALSAAIAAASRPDAPGPSAFEGWLVRVDPERLLDSGSTTARRAGAALVGLGYRSLEGRTTLQGDLLSIAAVGEAGDAPLSGNGPIEPGWLDLVPAEGAAGAFSVAVGPGAAAWGGVIELADRIERADASRAGLAPLGARLALLALAAGVRPDRDLWPNLKGLTGWIGLDAAGEPDRAVVALHAVDGEAARSVAGLIGRLAESDEQAEGPDPAGRRLGAVEGRELRLIVRGPTVLIGWGPDVIGRSLEAAAVPSRSAGPALRSSWDGEAPPGRLAVLWPGRLPWPEPAMGPLRSALEGSPPLIWSGRSDHGTTRDAIRWESLRSTLERLLDRLSLEPAGPGNAP